MKENILVVDDEPKIVRLVRAYLEKEGFQVTEATDGDEAMKAFRVAAPDLIVLDLMLPGVDGIDLTKSSGSVPFRNNEKHPMTKMPI